MTTESPTSKIIWMVIGALVSAVVAAPIAYYIIDPITPKPEITSSLSSQWLRLNDNMFLTTFRIKDVSRVPAKSVGLHFNFRRDGICFFDAPCEPEVYVVPNPFCRIMGQSGHKMDYNVSVVCDVINYGDDREFIFGQKYPPSDLIALNIVREGQSTKIDYKRCSPAKEEYMNTSYYVQGVACPTVSP